MKATMFLLCLFLPILLVLAKRNEPECEVCQGVLNKVAAELTNDDYSDYNKISEKLREFCGGSKNKENKFCFYIGALPESATSIINEVSKPMSYRKPVVKVCQALIAKDQQICELKYDKPLDWKTLDLSKMRVKELKKILEDWGEKCKGCTEKTEYIKMIEELKPKYVKEEL